MLILTTSTPDISSLTTKQVSFDNLEGERRNELTRHAVAIKEPGAGFKGITG